MNKKHFGIDIPWPNLSQAWAFARKWLLPNPGTLVLMVILALALPAIAGPSQAPSATSTSTISYQGRLADAGGNPLTGKYNLEFRIYDVPTGGTPLWTEMWTGGNAVDVSDGLFNVMLGSIDNTLASSIAGHDELYLGITVDTDDEMEPRVQLGSVPFSFQAQQAMTVPDGAITTEMIADGTITEDKLAPGLDLVPPGTIVMWSGSIADIPDGWALCDGTSGTPDLRDRFILSVSAGEDPGETGGSHTKALSVSNLPPHTHSFTTDPAGEHTHTGRLVQELSKENDGNDGNYYFGGTIEHKDNVKVDFTTNSAGTHTHNGTTNSTGSGSSFDIRPKYYKMAFIMKQ